MINSEIKSAFFGNRPVSSIYLGNTLIWPTVPYYTWYGLAGDNNFSSSLNWYNNSVPISNGNLYFQGSTRTAPFNNLTIDTPFNNIELQANASLFTISGNRFILSGSITNNSSNTQQFNNDIILGSSGSTINCNTSVITLAGSLSGSGSLTKLGTRTLTLSGNNTYTGNTFISSGLVNVLNNNPFGTGVVYCSGGASGIVVPSNAAPANAIINNPIFIDGDRPNSGHNIQVQKSATFNGLIAVGPGNATNRLNVQNDATMTINGGISALPSMANLLTMNGVGTYILSSTPIIFDNANSTAFYSDTGRETVIIAVSGNKFNNIRTGGTIRTDVPLAINNDTVLLGFVPAPSNGALRLGRINLNGNNQVFKNIQLASALVLLNFSDISGNNIFSNSSTFANLTANNTANTTYVGSISGNINLIKTGSGTLTLSGSTALNVGPRYTGFTAISAGTLTVHALSSNPSNKVNFVSFTNTSLTVNFGIVPVASEIYILLPSRTINSYPTVTLQNGGGRTGTYNSANSTLTIS